MSGFACLVNLDGGPVDRSVLDTMASFLAFRGPDAQQVAMEGPAGFAFALLRATEESAEEQQPFTFDRPSLDYRRRCASTHARSWPENFTPKIGMRGCTRPDIELILHAYHAWGESCVAHLLGDFAFAVWDSRQHRLFVVRDHMGVKPLYYAKIGSTIAVSNTLDCLRALPGVSCRRNESAIADFLLFEYNRDKATTFFADIQRVPPGNTMVCSPSKCSVQAYWTLPIDEPLRYRNRGEYPEQFRALLGEAVHDRCRVARPGIFMSGGLDSPTLAALSPSPPDLCAFTYVFEGFDRERPYAQMAAQHLGMKIVFREGMDEGVNPNWESEVIRTNEPPKIRCCWIAIELTLGLSPARIA